jgi:hypothetical protein
MEKTTFMFPYDVVWRTMRVLLTLTLYVPTSSGYLACKRHAVLGADQAAKLGSLPI